MKYFNVWSVTTNGAGPKVDIIVEAEDRRAARVKGKMEFSRLYGSLPKGVAFNVKEV